MPDERSHHPALRVAVLLLNCRGDATSDARACGSAMLLAQLDRTAMQFASVKSTVYSFNGSRRAFYEWLQRPAP